MSVDVLNKPRPGRRRDGGAKASITVLHARTNNLQGVDLRLPRDRMVVVTGVSGSGKSSLAFDTLYAEGQRRYIESLSSYARQFLEQMPRPDCDQILGLPPTIAIQQEMKGASPRSTVATTTEIYDFLRLLYARAGVPHCPDCGEPIQHQTLEQIVTAINDLPAGTRIHLLAPLVRGRRGHYRDLFDRIRSEGYVRARIDGEVRDLDEVDRLSRYQTHDIDVVVDRLVIEEAADGRVSDAKRRVRAMRLSDSVETALRAGSDTCIVLTEDGRELFFSRLFACPKCGRGFEEPNPNTFSFNSSYGRCEECKGLGTVDDFDEDLIVPDASKSTVGRRRHCLVRMGRPHRPALRADAGGADERPEARPAEALREAAEDEAPRADARRRPGEAARASIARTPSSPRCRSCARAAATRRSGGSRAS